jgi:MFS superfamily sulfate permease-like transporter
VDQHANSGILRDLMQTMFAYPRQDVTAGLVVFLVALPLCLGIAVACGVPPVSGLVAGIVGGLVIPLVSRSPLSVSGPAAGLTSIVLAELDHLGGLAPLLAAVMLAGLLQTAFGLARAGRFSTIVPSAVIQGMLAAIGITIVLKQIPVAFGVKGAFADIPTQWHLGATLLAAGSVVVLYGWKRTLLARWALLPPALVVVLLSSLVALAFAADPELGLSAAQYVQVPLGGATGLMAALTGPDFTALARSQTWIAAITIAIVASIESLLSIQAIDRLDPLRRQTPPDRELVAQGIGNTLSGLLGGLPVTSVIVRSGANVAAGGRERLSAVVHGTLLLVALLVAGGLLNRIPLACLAAVLIQVGLNLCKPSTFRAQYRLGLGQFLPFMLTIVAVLYFDLLKGVLVGIGIGIFFALHQYGSEALTRTADPDGTVRIRFNHDGTFLVKPALVTMLGTLGEGARVVIDGAGEYMDHDMKEAIATALADAEARKLSVRIEGIDLSGLAVGAGH